jgi:8-oxo-dGTP pyrophosphatase MutT (NUDIX family)
VRERLTARVLLLDRGDRILLMKGRLPGAPAAPGAWFTIGGGVEPGETLEAAAEREIREETGFLDAILEPELWSGNIMLSDREGRPVLFKDHFFVARCAGGTPSRRGWQSLEHEFIDDIRWWTLDELAACAEPVFPPDLAKRLGEVLGRRRGA